MKKLFLERNQWLIFRSTIQDDILDGCEGALLASKPATMKGTTGWAKFPGKQRRSYTNIERPFLMCLQSSSLPQEHSAGDHSGYCLNLVDVTRKDMQDKISRKISYILKDKI